MKEEKSRSKAAMNNLSNLIDNLNDGCYQDSEKSLVVIAQCLIDINYTLALMLDNMNKDNK